MFLTFYLKVHQPFRVKQYPFFSIGRDHNYFNGQEGKYNNRAIFEKIAKKSYLPTNRILLHLLNSFEHFKLNLSLSGVFLDQAELFCPEVVESFKKLVKTGKVEMLGETYYHSLSFVKMPGEFYHQVSLQEARLKEMFGVKPRVFSNTEAAYSNGIASMVKSLGYEGIVTEGADKVLGWRSPNFLYTAHSEPNLLLFLKNYRLSDDIAFRFSEKSWKEYPLTAEKFARWINGHGGEGEIINLFMDYETFGEHQWEDTGIFHFLEAMPHYLLKDGNHTFLTMCEAGEKIKPVASLDVPHIITWADTERDLSAWLDNEMQKTALEKIYALRDAVIISKNRAIKEDWRRLQTSDHFYYMCTKWFADGDVHKYFNPYESPYEAFINYMNAVRDLELRIK